MSKITVNLENTNIKTNEINEYNSIIKENHNLLTTRTGKGNDFLGWLDLPTNYDKEEFARIKQASSRIRENSDILIVLGIGGSYLGARAVVDALSHTFANLLPKERLNSPKIIYAGNNISSKYMSDLLELIDGQDISINVISKSGTTTETAVAFRILKEYIENKYGKEEAKKRIYATTDKQKGVLKALSIKEEYETFVVPDNVGGRYSVLTAVGLLPIAVSGIDIDKLIKGAQNAQIEYNNEELNECYKYAVARNILYNKGKTVEILANYEPSMIQFSEWWKQLYGESEGKENKGLFPASVSFTTDLHSLGQYIQQGMRNLFETVIKINKPVKDIVLKEEQDNSDDLNYLAGKTMDYVNKKAMEGTILAHVSGNVPNILIEVDKLDEENLGHLIYFFEKACAISGYILGVNPFDQPGVEEYKKNMFKLLGKPGY